jgi:hypothetical protein
MKPFAVSSTSKASGPQYMLRLLCLDFMKLCSATAAKTTLVTELQDKFMGVRKTRNLCAKIPNEFSTTRRALDKR